MAPKPVAGGNANTSVIALSVSCAFLALFLILSLWYVWVLRRRLKKKDRLAKISKEELESCRNEAQELRQKLDNYSKDYQGLMGELEKRTDHIISEIRVAKADARIMEAETDKVTEGSLQLRLDESTREILDLKKELRKLKLSVVMPETQHIVNQHCSEDITPELIVRHLLRNLQECERCREAVLRELAERESQIKCLTSQVKLKDKTMMGLRSQVSCGEQHREINKLLERQIENDREEIEALKETNNEKYRTIMDMCDKISEAEAASKRLRQELEDETCRRESMKQNLDCVVDRKNRLIRTAMAHFEEEEALLKTVGCELTARNLEAVRERLAGRLSSVQTLSRHFKLHFSNGPDGDPEETCCGDVRAETRSRLSSCR